MKLKLSQLIKNALIWLISLFLILLFCEICYRVYEFYFYKRQLKKTDTYILELLPDEPILQYKLKPNGSYMLGGKLLYKINSQGFRDYEPNGEENNVYKIVVLGDSYTFGWGVPMQHTYSKVLESSLRNEGYNVKVLNTGVFGYNTQMEVLYFKKEVLKWCPKPDLVIIAFTTEDTTVQGTVPRHPYTNHCESYNHLWFIEFIKSRINRLINKNKKQICAGYAKSGDFFPIKVRIPNPWISKEDRLSNNYLGWKRCKEALIEIKKLSKEKKFDLCLILLTDFARDLRNYDFLEYNKKVIGYCENLGIKTIDLFPYFKGADNMKFQNVEISDNHPNIAAHKIMGEVISFKLREWLKNDLERYRITKSKP